MGYANKRGDYYEARYKVENGKYRSFLGADGKPVRYDTQDAAKKAAERAEIEYRIRAEGLRPTGTPPLATPDHLSDSTQIYGTSPGDITFEDYVNLWFPEQDLAETTTATYESNIQCQLLPKFGPMRLRDITKRTVTDWLNELRDAGYASDSIRSYRGVLHVILEDAVEEGRITRNPAARKRNRGRRVTEHRDPPRPKVITDALGALLIAERMALLSGRDDEFLFEILKFYTGMRFGELRGLEALFVRNRAIEVAWQLIEVKGKLYRRRPKGGRTRLVHLPDFLWRITLDFIEQHDRTPCRCHGRTYLFRGHGKKRHAAGVSLRTIGQCLGISESTVSDAMRPGGPASAATRERVRKVAAELGYLPEAEREYVDHYRRATFRESLFMPAVSGMYPRHGRRIAAHPVPIATSPFPGIPVRGRAARTRADGVWAPIAEGMTPHGNRRSHRTSLVELGTPKKLIDHRIGHSDPSVQAVYTEVTQVMIDKMLSDLTAVWSDALDQRRLICPTSPVRLLDELLREGNGNVSLQRDRVAATPVPL
ncbi:LacI family transcriptional regulator [Nocardia nova]|uniref:LacI family transcriptional regulator n=1 Tax=Nocardia nova TaxID=37330 RepID=A0A2S6AKP3_9NOCA|nr:LacI family DNA-binding transcriptional regulator [Nocardia nova]PPJ35797.1 LacI family transcriptional regulator [Nocardia nova]